MIYNILNKIFLKKVTNAVHLLDCVTGKTIEINDQQYFQYENDLILVPLRRFATQFMVLSIEKEGKDKKTINSTIGGYMYQISRVLSKNNLKNAYIKKKF